MLAALGPLQACQLSRSWIGAECTRNFQTRVSDGERAAGSRALLQFSGTFGRKSSKPEARDRRHTRANTLAGANKANRAFYTSSTTRGSSILLSLPTLRHFQMLMRYLLRTWPASHMMQMQSPEHRPHVPSCGNLASGSWRSTAEGLQTIYQQQSEGLQAQDTFVLLTNRSL